MQCSVSSVEYLREIKCDEREAEYKHPSHASVTQIGFALSDVEKMRTISADV